MIATLSWAAVLAIVTTYAHLGRTGRPLLFHVANVIGACILAPINVAAGLIPQAGMNAVFGLVAAHALIRRRCSA